MKPFLHYYANQTGPQKKYLKERTDIFGNNLPVDEAAGYEGEFGARFEFTEAEWAMIEKRIPDYWYVGQLWPDGEWVDGAITGEYVFRKLFTDDEIPYLDTSYTNGKIIRILGQKRSCYYEIVVLRGLKEITVFFYYKVYETDTL